MTLVCKTFELDDSSFDCYVFIGVSKENGEHEYWFKGKDIAKFLEYKDTGQAIRINVNNGWKNDWETLIKKYPYSISDTPLNWHPSTIFISEHGLYALLFRSKKEEAVIFTDWLISYMLPFLKSCRNKILAEYNIHKKSLPATQVESGYFYAMTCLSLKADGLVKIGSTKDLKKRWSNYNCGRDKKNFMEVVYAFKSEKFRLIEQAVKKEFSTYREINEVYRMPSIDELQSFVEFIVLGDLV